MPEPSEQRYRSTSEPIYADLHSTAQFAELRRRYRGFALPWTVAFLVWYLTYVALSNWAPGLMNTEVVGNVNVALIFGLLQFVTTFGIAWLYSRHSTRTLDPLAAELLDRYDTRGAAGGHHLRKDDSR
ncbi:DUF485 domain-containing protein [Nocardioides sp. ChNu-153]|uniref:DUF485 domain-containing protein n=1 Tax=unclassified Nocardioides TaxID=2615069 RepID=UPI002405C761|nr:MULTISPECIES: DUF485 domain-containing protein [unclassified Nocardioides]MDF9715774.1 DUF485 domain-containing protein [Nocardioides sp. ChNu-99]MDN7121879.1 DUF485 domain-containing protein [Nocardioides sp. ChNu-153]